MLSLTDILWVLGTAIGCGALIGAEREWTRHDAGIRTNALVAMGAAVFGLISQYLYQSDTSDPGRIAAQVVTGIGFIGAGVILRQRTRVIGLTTAATVWVSAAAGLAAGGQHFPLAWLAAGAALGVQIILRAVEGPLLALRRVQHRRKPEYTLELLAPRGIDPHLQLLMDRFVGKGSMRLLDANIEPEEGERHRICLTVRPQGPEELQELRAHLALAGYVVQKSNEIASMR